MISCFISILSLSKNNNWRENIQCENWKLLFNYGNLWMLWCVIPFLCFLYFIGRAANQAHENHLALEYLKQHRDTSSWLHVYGTAPTRHLHLVCLFNYLLLFFFLNFFWSSYGFDLSGWTLIQVRIIVPSSYATIRLALNNISFKNSWSRFQARKLL